MAYIPDSGSVVAFQSNPSVLQTLTGLMSTNASVITVGTVIGNQSVSGTVGASVIGHAPVVIVGGSILTSSTANQSVSGALNISGSVLLGSSNASISAAVQGSVATVIIGGSIAATFTPPANQSVSGAVSVSNFPTTQNVSGSVAAFQGTSPWVVAPNNSSLYSLQQAGSILAVSGSFSAGNTSVMLLNSAAVVGSVATLQGTNPWITANTQTGTVVSSLVSTVPSSVIVGASIFGQLPAGTAPLGSVATLQGTNPWITTNVGSIITASQGSVAVAIISGSIAATFTPPANQSVSGEVSVSNFPTTQNVSGSVAAWLQSSNASVITVGTAAPNQSVSGTVQTDVRGSVATVIIGGSISATFTPPANQSVSGTVQSEQIGTRITSVISANPSSMLVGASIIGLPPVNVTNFPTTQNVSGSVAAWLQSSNASVITVGTAAANQSVSGTVGASVIGHAPVVIVGGSIAASFTPPANQSVSGTVGVTQQSTWIASVFGNVSVIGTVPVTQAGTWATSIVGAPVVIEDSGHGTGANPGLFNLAVRNDTLSSVTSADLDYSPYTVGPVGETIVANSPITKWVSGQTSIFSGVSVVAIAAQGASIFTYISGVQITNVGAAVSLVRFTGGLGSVLGWSVAPANGGSNIVFANPIKTGENSGFSASISAGGSVYLGVQGFISKI